MSQTEATDALAGFGMGVGVATYVIVVIALWVIGIIAYWKIFTKAGEKGWKSIIPFYNSYIQYKITWKTSIFFVSLILAIVYVIAVALGQNAGSSTAVLGIAGVVMIAAMIALCVISIIAWHKLSKAFGHGVGFTLGLIFLNPIFILILGLGSSQYIGIQE